MRALGLLAALLAITPALAQTGKMTPNDARAYLAAHDIWPNSGNAPQVIMDGDAKGLEALMTVGVNILAKSSLPQSPLELAAMSCIGARVAPAATVRTVDVLVQAGADPNAPGIQGLGPLMVAVQQCDGTVVARMVAVGAKLDSRTPQGFTPLSMALVVKNYSAADALIVAGARITPEMAHKFDGGTPDPQLATLVARASTP